MSATEQRAWSRDTPTGRFQAKEGITVTVDHELVDARVQEIRTHYQRTYGRTLSEHELANARTVLELRSVTGTGAQPAQSSHELAARHGWGVIVEANRNSGFAMKGPDGAYTEDSDPVVVEAVEAGIAAREAAYFAEREKWASGPAVLRTVAGPS